MVKLNKIYTRTGDAGTSGLVDGSRRSKADLRFATMGDVDEANAALGIARAALSGDPIAAVMIDRIQNELFDLGADLATPGEVEGALRILPEQVARLEREIDAMNEDLAPLESFILPGGTTAAAALQLARAIVRRAERAAVRCTVEDALSEPALTYLNRLSDHLFVLARRLNAAAGGDLLWRPGATRG